MSAGTLTLTNDSDTVNGVGTVFSTDLAVGDFIVVTIGGIPYTLPVKSIDSDIALTIISNYTGPTQSGAAWSAVPRTAMNLVTAAVVTQAAEALRGLNYDKQNWQLLFSASGQITVRLPDGSTFTGPSWNSIVQSLDDKANASDLNKKADLVSGVVAKAQGGTGLSSPFGSVSGSFCEGNDSRLSTIDGKSGGQLSSAFGKVSSLSGSFDSLYAGNRNYGLYQEQMNVPGAGYLYPHMSFKLYWPGNYGGVFTWSAWANANNPEYVLSWTYEGGTTPNRWQFNGTNGNATATGSWNGGSDVRHKYGIELLRNPLEAVLSFRGATYHKKDGGEEVGLISQDVEKYCPQAISETTREFSDGRKIEDFKNLNTAGVAAAYSVEATKQLVKLMKLMLADPDAALKRIEELETYINDAPVEDFGGHE